MTPYTNIGGEMSRYGGKNRTLRQWYEGKNFVPGNRQLGFALNKKELGMNTNEIYSQFSAANAEDYGANLDRASTATGLTNNEREVLEQLRKNEFLPKVTF